MSAALFHATLKELGRQLGRGSIRVPESATWRLDPGPDAITVVATMPASSLACNLQTDAAAVPSFAVCLAWHFELFALLGRREVRARVEVSGDVGAGSDVNRSLFLLHEFKLLLGPRFAFTPQLSVPWPGTPMINEAAGLRNSESSSAKSGSEHALECDFTTHSHVIDEFSAIDHIAGFRRQLPVGVFDGAVRRDTAWSPGKKSQVDLWTASLDGETIHLFELKKDGNVKLGILPEALWYARLLHRFRTQDFGGRAVRGGGPAIATIRKAKRIRMWLLTPRVHPLLEHRGRSPLEWFHAGLEGTGLDFGILPFEHENGRIRLRTDRRWPATV